MNFDLADVLPFLKSVPRHIETGYSVSVARELAADIARLSVDDERVWNYGVVFIGAEMSLRVTAFMDEVDAPDVALIR